MKIDRTGIILYTLNYLECVDFYQNILDLGIMFKTETLTCFELGACYLMVEIDDEEEDIPISQERVRTCIRMNVPDVRELANNLLSNNIDVDYQEHDWGTVAKFIDPDGNLCAFKDSASFEGQIEKHKEQ